MVDLLMPGTGFNLAVLTLAAGDFDHRALPRGQRYRIELLLPSNDEALAIPILVVRGAKPGPTLAASAAVHGDEFEGIQTIYEVFDELDPTVMRGDLLAVPIANPAAFRASTRESPLDGKNLARVFPGREKGTATERLAHWLSQVLIDRADLYIDFHSSGTRWAMPLLVGYCARDPRSFAAAAAFGAPAVWGHDEIPAGRTISRATELGIPALYTETYGGGTVHASDLLCYKQGLHNLLRHMDMVKEPVMPGPEPMRLRGSGDIDRSVSANQTGFFVAETKLLQALNAGATIGRILGPTGKTLEVIRAPHDGVLVLLRTLPSVSQGDSLALLADRDERESSSA